MAVLVILPGKPLLVVITSDYRAFFWPFILVSEQMSLEVLEGFSALRALALLPGLVIELATAGCGAAAVATLPGYLRVDG